MFGHGLSDKFTFDLKLSHSCGPLEQSSGGNIKPLHAIGIRAMKLPEALPTATVCPKKAVAPIQTQADPTGSFTPALFNMAEKIQEE